MATLTCCPLEHQFCAPLGPAAPPRVAPEAECSGPFSRVTHTALLRCGEAAGSPQQELVDLKVLDGSTGSSVRLTLYSTDTVDALIRKYLQMKPELVGNLHLAYNGKQVSKGKSLCELGVKPGATFITYQKCVGG